MSNFLNKLFGYFLTGGTSALVDVGGFYFLFKYGFNIFLAASISFSLAAIVNYQLTSRFVFNQIPTKNRFYKFLIVALFGLAINVSITGVLVNFLDYNPILSKLIAVVLAFIVNFSLNLMIVFNLPKSST